MNKTHLEVLRNQITEKRSKGDYKMNAEEYLMNRELIEKQLGNLGTNVATS
jgi:hypothetical protein